VSSRVGRAVALLAAAVLVAAACSPSSATPRASTSEQIDASDSLPAPTAAPTPEPQVKTSDELIASALASGSITYDQSILYRAQSIFDYADLPAEYAGPIADVDAAGPLLREIDANESKLSADTLAQLAPYRVRPSDPTSVFSKPTTARSSNGALADARPLAADATALWVSKPAAGGKARVWVRSSGDAAAALDAHVADVEKVWNAYPGIFTYPKADQPNVPSAVVNPDGAIDFYFASFTDLDPRRTDCQANPGKPYCTFGKANAAGFAHWAGPYSGSTSSAYLVVDGAARGDSLLDTLAHELAHAAQFAYDYSESSWLMESTATWVGYKVIKKLGGDAADTYRWLDQFFGSLDQTLSRTTNYNAYAAWLYFLYASMERGNGVVTDVWQEAAASGVQSEKAVDQVMPFDQYFAGFAVRNWNMDSVDPKYKKADDTFPGGLAPKPKADVKALGGGKESKLGVTLPALAAAYYSYSFADSTRDVTFENTLAGVDGAHVWAIPQIGGEWKAPQDWTASTRTKFCRNIADQDLTQLIVVVSNASMTDKLTSASDDPSIKTGTQGCSGWTGTMTGSEWWGPSGNHGTATSTFTGLWMADDGGDAVCPQGSTDCTLFRASGSIAWTRDSHYDGKCDANVSGTLPATDPYGDQQVFYLRQVDENHLEYFGNGYFAGPASGCINHVTTSVYPPAFFEIYEGASGDQPPDGTGGTCAFTTWQIDPKADAISGSCYAYKNDYTWLEFEWSLTRVDGAK
jgi:hypothetical protein